MRIPRIYVDAPLSPGAEVTLDARAANHAARVLRLAQDAPVVLFNGDGHDWPARLTAVRRETVTAVAATAAAPAAAESPLSITLAQGVSRGERMDYTLQKAVELGVRAVLPLWTERTQVRLKGERLERRLRHWTGVLISACEQCGRARVPALLTPTGLPAWLAEPPPGRRLFLDPRCAAGPRDLAPAPTELVLLAGPEGGLSEGERAQATAAGFEGLRLGPRVLRTETAAVAALAALQALWGDMG